MKFEFEFGFLVWFSLFHFYYGEQPRSSCENIDLPYKTMNNSCSNFRDVCMKRDDRECNMFQNVCKQCPPSNYSVLMFLDIIKLKDQMTTMQSKLNSFTGLKNSFGNYFAAVYILVGIIIFLLILMFLEIRFKILTKCCIKFDRNDYVYLDSRKAKRDIELNQKLNIKIDHLNDQLNISSGQYSELNQKINSIETNLGNNLENLNDNMKRINEFMDKSINKVNSMKFNVSGALRPIELFIRPNENVLQVKRQICSHWPAAKPDDYKIMTIKFKCQPLNDHNNFISYNIPTNSTLDCELDNKLNPNDYLILKLQGTLDLPELLKFSKEKTISDIKSFITCYNNNISNPIIREMKTGQELKNEIILRNSKLEDDDWIDIITKTNRTLTVRSLFNESEFIICELSNIDMILEIKKQIKSQLNLKNENIILFWNYLHLEDDKYIHDYKINDAFPIKFCYLNMLNEMQIKSRNIIKNDFYTLTKGCHLGKNIFVQRYKLKEKISIIKSSSLRNQLINYQIINSHPRFMSLHGMFLDKTDLYVFLENNFDFEVIINEVRNDLKLSENEIAKWSMQILEGLKLLHDNNIVHKNLKPTSIFVDSHRNIKLSCFNMIGSLHDDEYIQVDSELIINYWSPEVLKSQQFSIKSDVWSFGAVLYYLITKNYFPKLGENYSYSKTEYSDLGVSDELQDFLNKCLIEDQNERPDVDLLLKHSFLRRSS